MTLREVSRHSGVSEGAISMGENGERDLRVPTLEAIVERGLRISMVEFYGALPSKEPRRSRKVAA